MQEDQLKSGARPGDKGFGEDPEDHFGKTQCTRAEAKCADINLAGTLTTVSDGGPTRDVVPTVQPPTYVEFYRGIAKALTGEGESPVKPEGARDVLRIVEAAIESSKEERTITL